MGWLGWGTEAEAVRCWSAAGLSPRHTTIPSISPKESAFCVKGFCSARNWCQSNREAFTTATATISPSQFQSQFLPFVEHMNTRVVTTTTPSINPVRLPHQGLAASSPSAKSRSSTDHQPLRELYNWRHGRRQGCTSTKPNPSPV
jgi:hypothetical protein